MTNAPSNLPPRKIVEAFFGEHPVVISPLYGGLTNVTYLVVRPTARFILQRISPAFSPEAWRDLETVLHHLAREGWEVQQLLHTQADRPYIQDEQGIWWRSFTYIDADSASDSILSKEVLRKTGSLLSKLHTSLAKLDYEPTATIPHFHETAYFLQKLEKCSSQLPTKELRTLAKDIIIAYKSLGQLPVTIPQLIHGDPRTNNMLFRKGLPFTYIDFEALMRGSVWIDIGDLLRSINGNEEQTEAQFSLDRTRQIIKGYHETTHTAASFATFLSQSLLAMQHICLELAMRFMVDIVEDTYFGWDSNHYENRAAHNLARARAQWKIYQQSK
jgi:Ser/Thr protein kinase RdoA (MazF antagonist)